MADSDAFQRLLLLSNTTQSLISHFDSALSSLIASLATTSRSTAATASSSVDADRTSSLDTLCALAAHLKSRISTLILLLIHSSPKDYAAASTVRAITPLMSEVGGKVIPGLVSTATAVANGETTAAWPIVVRKAVVSNVAQIVAAVAAAVGEIGTAGQGLRDAIAGGEDAVANAKIVKDTRYGQSLLASAGRVWGGVDAVVALNGGDALLKMVLERIEERRAMVVDAVSELRDLGSRKEENDDDSENEDDDLMDFDGELDEDLRDLYDSVMTKLQTLDDLFAQPEQALRGRDMSKVTLTDGQHPVDRLIDAAKQIQEAVDDVAAGFYSGDEDDVNSSMDTIHDQVRAIDSALSTLSTDETNGGGEKATDMIKLLETWAI